MKHTNKKITKINKGDDEWYYFEPNNLVQEICKVTGYVLNFDGPILDPEWYREVYDVIRTAKPSDTLRLVVNSHGGNPDTSVQLFDMLSKCNAYTICELHCAMSAASDIVLCCDEIEVGLTSRMMVHCSSYGTYGKTPDIKKQANFESEYEKIIFNLLYQGFLTEEEIERARNGEEFYFLSKDITKRLKNWVPVKDRNI